MGHSDTIASVAILYRNDTIALGRDNIEFSVPDRETSGEMGM